MEGLEDKIGTILNNPQLMQQIMSMASSLSAPQQEKEAEAPSNAFPDFDPDMIRKLMSFMGNLNVNDQQRTLLHALRPYLTDARIQKLEKAMRAAKLANAASAALGSGALSFLNGR